MKSCVMALQTKKEEARNEFPAGKKSEYTNNGVYTQTKLPATI